MEPSARLERGNRAQHEDERHEAPGNDPIDRERKERAPLEHIEAAHRRREDVEERRYERIARVIYELGERHCRIRADEFQRETREQDQFDDPEQVPDDLGHAVRRLCIWIHSNSVSW